MGIRLTRFPGYGFTMETFSGVITPDHLFNRLSALREGDLARWVGYFDPTADLTLLDVATLANLRRAHAVRQRELDVDKSLQAFVCGQGPNEGPNKHVVEFWCRFVQAGGEHRIAAALFPSLEAACDWMRLPEGAHQALTEQIEAEMSARREAGRAPEGGPAERRH